MTLVPTVLDPEIAVEHLVWVPEVDGTGAVVTGRHGLVQGQLQPPVTRMVFAIYPMHWRNPHTDPITTDEMARTLSDVLIDVPDSTIYKKLDHVVISGNDFEVQGQPWDSDWGQDMPFSDYDDCFGGVVHARRVTN